MANTEERPWITGPALELMLAVGSAGAPPVPRAPFVDGPVFREGDEVLVDDGTTEWVGVLVPEMGQLRVAKKEDLSYRQWRWWRYVVGWRRP